MKHHLLTLLIPLTFFFAACSSDDEGGGEPPRGELSVTQLARDTEGLNTLRAIDNLLENPQVGSSSILNQLASDEYTLLAPNDEAFQNFFNAIGVTDPSLVDLGVLSSILSYHIIPNQTLQIGQLDSGYVTLSRQIVSVSQRDSVNLNADVPVQPTTTIVSPNPLFASNGVVHVIDEVLLPPNLQSEVDQFGTVAGLMDVLADVDLMNRIVSAAQFESLLADDTRSLTVIAPVDGFLFSSNLNTSNEGVTFFSANHIIGSAIDVASPPRKATTLAGIPVYLSAAGDGAMFLNGQIVVNRGAQANNGQVLLTNNAIEPPTDVAGGLGAIAEATGQTFGIFQAALSQAELTLDGEKTLFVPTDSAFFRAGLVATVDSAARIDPALLSNILSSHVVEGVQFSSDLESGTLTTLSGSDITLTLTDSQATISDTDADSEDAQFIFLDEYVFFGSLADVEELTEVGVIHAIDELLLP